MSYQDDGDPRFVGLQRVEGTIDGREGSVGIQTVGDFDGKVAKASSKVGPVRAPAIFAGMIGRGEFVAPMDSTPTFTLDCSFG